MPRASSRSSSSDCESSSRRGDELAPGGRGIARRCGPRSSAADRQRDQPLLGAVMEVALEPAARRVARLDQPGARGRRAPRPRLELRLQAFALERDVGGGGDELEQLRLVGERRVVDQRGDVLPALVDRRRGAARALLRGAGPAARGIDVALEARQPVDQLERRIMQGLGQQLAEPRCDPAPAAARRRGPRSRRGRASSATGRTGTREAPRPARSSVIS